MLIVVGPVGTVDKPSMFFARLIQAACGNHQEKVAEGIRFRFPQRRQFQRAFPCSPSFFVEI
jgi:hypothetical protein